MKIRPIAVLSDSVVEKIAAGEVIERPASIIKELLENSIDAGAHCIEIRLTEGGKNAISVTDDGVGIPAYEMSLALKAHATSKISAFEDLTRVRTFGFRGEALASIAAVSKLDLLSRTHDSDMGIRVRSEGGRIFSNEPYGMPAGTTVSVTQLFFNTPARRKFLRSAGTELGHIDRVIRSAALALLDQEFYLENDGEIALHLPRAGELGQRLTQLYGREVSEKCVPFEGTDGPLQVLGYVSNSHQSYGKPQEIWFYVNDRPVKDRMLQAALMEGYRSALMERRYPLAVVHLTVPTDMVDVNVHPTKTEVRFTDTQPVFRLLSKAVAASLRDTVPVMVSPDFTPIPEPLAADGGGLLAIAQTAPMPYLAEEMAKGPFSQLQHLGTLDQTYLLFQGPQSFVVIDQHAAHERVLFEQLSDSFQLNSPRSQRLLLPMTFEVTREQESKLTELEGALIKFGFEIEPFGDKTKVIRAVPEILGTHDPRPLLSDLLNEETAWQDRIDELTSRIACHSAVRAHDRLGSNEISNLLEQMDRVDLASNCPHGRPTFLRFTIGDFERLFRRK
jgi:DNA mismatch repair protein MutL